MRRNYLRVRGEYAPRFSVRAVYGELPPRARRIPPSMVNPINTVGTTSACAENTVHVRVLGPKGRELPPRARRIRAMTPRGLIQRGTTSACAENTGQSWSWRGRHRNYLRVRGEYVCTGPHARDVRELPPRARRIRSARPCASGRDGTTSACAENTIRRNPIAGNHGNYLRVRGEYLSAPCRGR